MLEGLIITMSSNKGDTILDPFVGSGTTMIAANNLERNAIGIDIDKRYKPVIERRLKEEVNKQPQIL